jgi:uncharacterized protein
MLDESAPPEAAQPPSSQPIDPAGEVSDQLAPASEVLEVREGALDLEAEAQPAHLSAVAPVSEPERVASVDVLRGVAVLGILAMNIVSFGWPQSVYFNPLRGGGFDGLDRVLWIVNHLVFEMKMMTLFSMLFGAGLVLMRERADSQGRSIRKTYYRRVLGLLAIGLAHSYLIWSGDILVMYAQCGLLLYPLRRLSARTLLVLGVAALLVIVPPLQGFVAAMDYARAASARVEAREKVGQQPSTLDRKVKEVWEKVRTNLQPNPERSRRLFERELATYHGGYFGIVQERARQLWVGQTIGFLLGGLWLAGGRMLIGMALMKWGVFAARRSSPFYRGLMAFGYGLGVPLVACDAWLLIRTQFGWESFLRGGIYLNYFGSVLVALGHTGLVMTVYQSAALQGLTRRLAAVGRMALSNYLFDSLCCTFLFYGYGLAQLPQFRHS